MLKLLLLTSFVVSLSSFDATANPVLALPWEPEDRLNNDGWKKAHESFIATTKTKGKTIEIVFYGDSITNGWRSAMDIWNKYWGPNAVNYGISGDQTQHLIWRMQHEEIDGLNPKVVVLKIGTNNLGANKGHGENIAKGITTIVDILRHRLPNTKVLLLGILPRGDGKTRELQFDDDIQKINSMISKDADGKNVVYLDMRSHFLEDEKHLKEGIFPDGLHPNHAGYQIWADAMAPTLKKMLE